MLCMTTHCAFAHWAACAHVRARGHKTFMVSNARFISTPSCWPNNELGASRLLALVRCIAPPAAHALATHTPHKHPSIPPSYISATTPATLEARPILTALELLPPPTLQARPHRTSTRSRALHMPAALLPEIRPRTVTCEVVALNTGACVLVAPWPPPPPLCLGELAASPPAGGSIGATMISAQQPPLELKQNEEVSASEDTTDEEMEGVTT
eukprot:1161309-Pelagomonas_calceolata.AAC.11